MRAAHDGLPACFSRNISAIWHRAAVYVSQAIFDFAAAQGPADCLAIPGDFFMPAYLMVCADDYRYKDIIFA